VDVGMSGGPTRRAVLGGAAAGAAGLSLSSRGRAKAALPNLVFLSTDQQTARTLGHLGGTEGATPRLDELVEMGVSFKRGYCADAVCCAARASWFTGLPPSRHGVMINRLPLDKSIPTLGSLFAEHAPHRRFYIGKWHIPGRRPSEYYQLLHPSSSMGTGTDLAALRAVEGFLSSYAEDAPFLLNISLLNPHDIVQAPKFGHLRNTTVDVGPPPEATPELPPNHRTRHPEAALLKEVKRAARSLDRWDDTRWRQYRWWYQALTRQVDATATSVIQAILGSRFGRDTVIVMTSDHGEANGEFGMRYKQNLYEATGHVPFMVFGERVPQGRLDTKSLVSGVDVLPTLCELGGVPVPEGLMGRSLVPLLADPAAPWRDHLVVEATVDGRAIYTADRKLIRYRGDPVVQLFDVEADPYELTELSASEPGAVEELSSLLDAREAAHTLHPLSPQGYHAALAVSRVK